MLIIKHAPMSKSILGIAIMVQALQQIDFKIQKKFIIKFLSMVAIPDSPSLIIYVINHDYPLTVSFTFQIFSVMEVT